jgi:broad specificity phosphatase PhoE
MPHLYLVRHGQPDFTGHYDSITELGARQSAWLGAHFAAQERRFARVASGTLQRQVATCAGLRSAMPGAPASTQDARFNEYDHASLLAFFEDDGVQELRKAGDRRGYFSAIRHALQAWSRHEGPVAGGESWAEFGARIRAGVTDLCSGLTRDDHVLVVTSGGVVGRFTADVLGAGADAAIQLNLQTRNTSVTELIVTGNDSARLVAFNAVPHLEVPERMGAVTFV